MKPLEKMAKEAPKEEASESVDAAQDVLDALASKDAAALDLALQRHYEVCESGYKASDEEE